MKWIELYVTKSEDSNPNYDYLNERNFSSGFETCKHCGSNVIVYTAYGTKYCAVCKRECK